MGQVSFVIACGLPLAAGTLVVSKLAFECGAQTLAAIALIGGVVVSTCALWFVPAIHGPAKGKARRNDT